MFRNKQRNLIYFLIIVIPSLFFLVKMRNFSSLKFGVVRFFRMPIRMLSGSALEMKKILYYHRTFDEYRRLKKETDYLKARLIGLEEVMLENARLKKLLDFRKNMIYSSVAANVTGRDPSNWNASMIIDKGKSSGIRQGMPVVTAAGVVGKIAEVDKESSKVILLTDPNFSVAALIKGARESGLVSGSLEGVCRMKYLDENARIRLGDKVITSKLSADFPESILIGTIVRIKKDPETSTLGCVIQPSVSFSQIEEVLVLLK